MRILELREELNLTQAEIAEVIKTSRTNIGRWEKGLNEPTASQLIKLADFFDCSIDYLLGRTDEFDYAKSTKKKSAELTSSEQTLLEDFRSLPKPDQAQAQEYMRFLANRYADQRGIKRKKA